MYTFMYPHMYYVSTYVHIYVSTYVQFMYHLCILGLTRQTMEKALSIGMMEAVRLTRMFRKEGIRLKSRKTRKHLKKTGGGREGEA